MENLPVEVVRQVILSILDDPRSLLNYISSSVHNLNIARGIRNDIMAYYYRYLNGSQYNSRIVRRISQQLYANLDEGRAAELLGILEEIPDNTPPRMRREAILVARYWRSTMVIDPLTTAMWVLYYVDDPAVGDGSGRVSREQYRHLRDYMEKYIEEYLDNDPAELQKLPRMSSPLRRS
jgi:hypothetical protein